MLNPRLCASPPVFHNNATRFAPVLSVIIRAAKLCNWTFVEEVMVSVCVEKLLRRLGSTWSANTVPVFEMTPGVPASVRMVTVAVPPLAMVPSKQVTVPPASEQVPAVVVADRKVTAEGKGSITVTLVADAGPLFVIERV